MNFKYDVATEVTKDGLILQEVSHDFLGVRERLVRNVINTQDDQIREALIKLGWTPPAEERKIL